MSAEHEAAILSDLRRTRTQLKKSYEVTPSESHGPTAWSMRLTVEEADLLLAIVDERDALKRRLVGDWEGDTTESGTPVLTDAEKTTINTCPHAGTHHNCPLGGCPTFERREIVADPHAEHEHCDTRLGCIPKPITGSAVMSAGAVIGPMFSGGIKVVGREEREAPEAWIFDETRHTWLCGGAGCSTMHDGCGCHSTTNRTRINGWMPASEA